MTAPAKRVLLIEDEKHIRYLVSSILRRKGYDLTEAENGHSAVELMQDAPSFDLIITDLQMPGLSGVALLRKLHHLQPETPIIVISAYIGTDWAKDAVADAVVALPKPFSHAQLVSVVDAIV